MIARRVAGVLLPLPAVTLAVAAIVFLALRVIPGDAVDRLASQGVPPTQRDAIRDQLGLGEPLHVQFANFISRLIQLDFGDSFYSGTPVLDQLAEALPVTIELATAAVVVMLFVGLLGGVLAASKRGTWIDFVLRATATTLFSIPWFSLGIILILLFGVKLGWFPTFGRLPADAGYNGVTNFVLIDAFIEQRFDWIVPWLQHLALPALTLGLTTAGFILRVTRASFLDIRRSEFVTTARAKGMSESRVLRNHMARNAMIPIATIVGLQVGTLLGGAVVTEVVFAYPGMGQLLVQSILQRDFPVAEGAAIVIAFTCVLINVLTDLAYIAIDPRLRTEAQ